MARAHSLPHFGCLPAHPWAQPGLAWLPALLLLPTRLQAGSSGGRGGGPGRMERGRMEGPGQTSPPCCQERRCRPLLAPAPRHPAAWHACSPASAEGGTGLGRGCGGGCLPPRHPLRLLRRGLVPTQWVHGGDGAAPDAPRCAWTSPRGCPQPQVAPGSMGRAAGGGLGGSCRSIPPRHHGSRGISPADRCHIATEMWSPLPGNRCLVLLPRPSSPAWNFPCRCAPV